MKDATRTSPLYQDAVHESAWKHVTGRATFVDDMPDKDGLLYAQLITSPVAHGRIKLIDTAAAEALPGIACVLTAHDIPGFNDTSAFAKDEELLASSTVHCVGQVIAVVLGESYEACRLAATHVVVDIDPLPAIFDIREAIEKKSLFPGTHIIARGDLDAAFENADLIIEGEVESPGQEHWYLETHCAQAELNEDNDIILYSSTQNLKDIQSKVSAVLSIDESRVVVEMPRMGGAFGGKETQAAPYATLAALGAWKTGRPVRVWLDRDEDASITGKRHPFYSKYRAAFDKKGRILGFKVEIYANAGWAADLSQSITDRSLFHLDGCYFIPALHFEGRIAKTNLVSNTAFRGFGAPQGIIVVETAMNRAARQLGIDPVDIRIRNYYGAAPRNIMQYGAVLDDFRIPKMTDEIIETSKYRKRKAAIDTFNLSSQFIKRGIGFMPVKFGISFTNTMLNQGGALVLIYTDGSVIINHGGAEMGQGLHSKMIAIAAHELGIRPNRIRLKNSRTDKVPNTSATAASSGTDLNGAAISNACQQLSKRLRRNAAKIFETPVEEQDKIIFDNGYCFSPSGDRIPIEDVIKRTYTDRESLAASGFYATPGIKYDASLGRGTPFAYYAYGVCVLEIEVCTLTGEYRLTDVEIINDVGDSILPNIDLGQVEGAFVQGYGWLSTEELIWGKDGKLRTPNPATYKIPTVGTVPDKEHFRIRLLEDASGEAIHGSKAVGEPPFVLAVGLIQALEHAISATGTDPKRDPVISLPATAESVLRAIYAQRSS